MLSNIGSLRELAAQLLKALPPSRSLRTYTYTSIFNMYYVGCGCGCGGGSGCGFVGAGVGVGVSVTRSGI
jgi:hypothetical protein